MKVKLLKRIRKYYVIKFAMLPHMEKECWYKVRKVDGRIQQYKTLEELLRDELIANHGLSLYRRYITKKRQLRDNKVLRQLNLQQYEHRI